jgi:lipopolysaccharide export system permease protein
MVVKPILWFVLAAMLVGEFVTPYLDQLADGRRQLQRSGMESGADNGGVWSVEGNEYIHINAVFPGGVLFGVTRYQFDEQRQLQAASFSSRASFDRSRRHWVEENVAITRFSPGQTVADKLVTRIWQSELTPALLQQNVLAPENLSIQGLWGYTQFLRQQQRDSGAYQLALWAKLLQPLTVIGLVVLAIGFVFGPLRESTMGLRIFVGVVTGIGFRILQDMLEPSSLVFGFPPVVAVSLPIVLCVVIGARLLRRAA